MTSYYKNDATEPETRVAESRERTPEVDTEKLRERWGRILEEKNFLTNRIGETCRYIGFGVLAAFYALHTSDSKFAHDIVSSYRPILYLICLSGLITILSDYLQYVCGYIAANKALARTDIYKYNTGWLSYRLREFFYNFKQASTLFGAVLTMYLVLRSAN